MANGYRPGGWRINQALERIRQFNYSAGAMLDEIRSVVDNTWADGDKRHLDELLFELTSTITAKSNEITRKLWEQTIDTDTDAS